MAPPAKPPPAKPQEPVYTKDDLEYYSGAADVAATQPVREDLDGPYKAYNINLKAPIFTAVGANPRAEVHLQEWAKVLAGDPIEIRLEDGYGYKVMTIDEWTLKWKRNDDFPECLCCGSTRTKEHHFVQEWCRSAKTWSAESFCETCHSWSYRAYADPNYLTPEDHEKYMWEKMVVQNDAYLDKRIAAMP